MVPSSRFREDLEEVNRLMHELSNADQHIRQKSVTLFKHYLWARQMHLAPDQRSEIFKQSYTQLFNMLRDPSKSVREEAIETIHYFYTRILTETENCLAFLLPVLIERIGMVEVAENSAQLRLRLLKLILDLISSYSAKRLQLFASPIVTICKQMMKDRFPMIKEMSCNVLLKLSQKTPQEMSHLGELILKPLIVNLSNPSSRVRVAVVRCMGDILMHTETISLEESLVPLTEKLLDSNSDVRKALVQVAGIWLLEHKDRHLLFHKLLPLILTGLTDEVPANRHEVDVLWSCIGSQYQSENRGQLDDELNPHPPQIESYPHEAKRPSIGCRKLVESQMGKMIPDLLIDLQSFKPLMRMRCAQLFYAIVLHVEASILPYLPQILSGIFSAVRDEDTVVKMHIIRAAELIACYVPAASWWTLVYPVLEAPHHFGHLAILGALLRGSTTVLPSDMIMEIAAQLATPSICYTRISHNRTELMSCAKALQNKYHKDVDAMKFSQSLFNIIVCLVSTSKGLNGYGLNLLDSLQKVVNIDDLWFCHTTQLLRQINKDPNCWNEDAIESCILQTILTQSGRAFFENFETIVGILLNALNPQVTVERRLKTFMALANGYEMMGACFKNLSHVNKYMPKLIGECFTPALSWQPGRIAEVMRTCAATCLALTIAPGQFLHLFQSRLQMRTLFNRLLPPLLALLTDSNSISRKLAIENIIYIKQHLEAKRLWRQIDLLEVYPEILRELDDPTQTVRWCAISGFKLIVENAPITNSQRYCDPHHEVVIDILFMHINDEDEKMRGDVIDLLKVMATVNSGMIVTKATKHMNHVFDKQICMDLIHLAQHY